MKSQKRKLRLREPVKDLLAALLLYGVIVLGVIVLNARIEYLNNIQSDKEITTYEINR